MFYPKFVCEKLEHATIAQRIDMYSHIVPRTSTVAAEALESALS